MHELMDGLAERSRLLVLDFDQIGSETPPYANIQTFFQAAAKQNIDPRAPSARQAFNNSALEAYQAKFLIARYGEDRRAMLAGSAIAAEGRTIHLGIDIFATELETVFAPCDAMVTVVDQEKQSHSFGHYIVLQSINQAMPYIFLGHLAQSALEPGVHVKAGQHIAKLGDYVDNENGGWSRHLHLQMMRTLPRSPKELVGYSTKQDFSNNTEKFPDPALFFAEFQTIINKAVL
jgi:murein DD-endopeptidase MepM/ murein hydrolase activator NlpD